MSLPPTGALDPVSQVCPECRFRWDCDAETAMRVAHATAGRYHTLLAGRDPQSCPIPGGWTIQQYLWHVVDGLRLGMERLWTIELDASFGFPAYDQDEIARARRYEQMSPTVGLRALDQVALSWQRVVKAATGGTTVGRPGGMTLSALDLVRRTSHEVFHHACDIEKVPAR